MARIDDLAVSVFTVPLPQAEADGTFQWDTTTVVVAEPVAEGTLGLGFTYGSPACADVIRHELRPAIIGRCALDPPGAWQAMVATVRNSGRPGVASMAIAAVDIALWDLKAKLLDISLLDLLGACRDEIAVYGSGGFTSLSDEELCMQLSTWSNDLDIGKVKMKIGTDWGAAEQRDLERVTLARAAVGDDVELFVDANGAYSAKQAIRLGRAFEELDVRWLEEPVSSDDLDGLRAVRSALGIDVTAGEYGYDLTYFQRMCAARAVDVLQIDVSRCAGISEWTRAAAVAAAHGLSVSAHCAPSLHAALACAVPNVRHIEYFADHAYVDRELLDGVLDPVHGSLRPDRSRPGLGLALRSDRDRYREA